VVVGGMEGWLKYVAPGRKMSKYGPGGGPLSTAVMLIFKTINK